jgi:hypothetical protein
MHRLLPRELRDQIYEVLIGPPSIGRYIERLDVVDVYPGSRKDKDIWWRSDYTGDEVATEISERWYQTREFHIQPGQRVKGEWSLENFLKIDCRNPKRTFLPARAVRKLVVDMFLDDIKSPLRLYKKHFALLSSDATITLKLRSGIPSRYKDLIHAKVRRAVPIVRHNADRNVIVECTSYLYGCGCHIETRYSTNDHTNKVGAIETHLNHRGDPS